MTAVQSLTGRADYPSFDYGGMIHSAPKRMRMCMADESARIDNGWAWTAPEHCRLECHCSQGEKENREQSVAMVRAQPFNKSLPTAEGTGEVSVQRGRIRPPEKVSCCPLPQELSPVMDESFASACSCCPSRATMKQHPHSVGSLECVEGREGETVAAGSMSRPSARHVFEDCPLIEIVHFHECLRGELRSLRANVETLCGQMRDLHLNSAAATATPPLPPEENGNNEGGSTAVTSAEPVVIGQLQEVREGNDPAANADDDAVITTSITTSNGNTNSNSSSDAGAFPREHLELEVQVLSQFQLLWAVFQSHSTAEDEVIWPALKEKARSSGGKLKLVNHDAGSNTASGNSDVEGDVVKSGARNSAREPGQEPLSSRGVEGGSAAACATRGMATESPGGPTRQAGSGSDGEGGGLREGNGDREEEERRVGEAMIDEAEYTEEHHEENRLFESMQEILKRLRNTRHSRVPERLRVVAGLGKKTDEMCRHLMTHLDKEEESALPLIKHYFTGPEMGALVGKIMGKRPTELMQTILAMMIKNLPVEEVHTMMRYMRDAVKDTYFEKWLASGGFQWPTNAQNKKAELRRSRDGSGWRGNSSCCDPLHPTVAAKAAAAPSGVLLPSGGGGVPKRRGGRDRGRGDGRCMLDGEFQRLGLRVSGTGTPMPGPSSSSPTAPADGAHGGIRGHGSGKEEGEGGGNQATEQGGRSDDGVDGRDPSRGLDAAPTRAAGEKSTCTVCSYIGRCPANEPLTQNEFESAVKRLSKVNGLSTERKTGLVQMMRNHMYRGRKRPRTESSSSSSSPGSTAPFSSSSSSFSSATSAPPSSFSAPDGARPASVARTGTMKTVSAGATLVAPARYYTSTQPDIEDAGGGGDGGDGGDRFAVLPQALFTREELAPTYHHIAAPGGGNLGGSREAGGRDGSEVEGGEGKVVLGCPHYRRACKIRTPCCQKLFTCRLCHDQASDHTVDRGEVTEMMCMRCETLQPVHSECRNPSCRPMDAEKDRSDKGRRMARYYCGICHLFDDAPDKDIYHCPYCNMCRLGKGLGVDFFHCMTCNACISLDAPTHTCLSKSLESDCSICGSSLFTSTNQVKGLRCGHFMHLTCYKEYISRAESREFWYRCPVCRKSMEDMREYFSQMDAVVASQPMPEEYANRRSKVLCHDCERYTEVPYHFLYLKCGACGSYNTRAEGEVSSNGATVGETSASTPTPPPDP